MKLRTLTIRQFKGIEHYTLTPDERITTIRATNGAGKTTVHDALVWCLTGYDAQGRADYLIKPLDADGRTPAPGSHGRSRL